MNSVVHPSTTLHHAERSPLRLREQPPRQLLAQQVLRQDHVPARSKQELSTRTSQRTATGEAQTCLRAIPRATRHRSTHPRDLMLQHVQASA
eukprot:6173488-Pleurochrysis_carterae.AAC.7